MIHRRHIEELVTVNDAGIGDAFGTLFNQNFIILNYEDLSLTFPVAGSLRSLTCHQQKTRPDCSVLEWNAELDGTGAPAYILAGLDFRIGFYVQSLSVDVYKQIFKMEHGRDPKPNEIPKVMYSGGFYDTEWIAETPSRTSPTLESGKPVNHTTILNMGFGDATLSEYCWADGVKQTKTPTFSNKWGLDTYYYIDGKPYGDGEKWCNQAYDFWKLEIPEEYSKAKHIKWYTI